MGTNIMNKWKRIIGVLLIAVDLIAMCYGIKYNALDGLVIVLVVKV